MSKHTTEIRIKRRPWTSRLLLMPYFFWKHYQIGKGFTSRRYRLIAAVHMAWLTIRPDWMRPRMARPHGSCGGSMRLDEGPVMRSGFSSGPSTPKPAMTPRGQNGGYQPIRRDGAIIPPPRTP